MRGFERKNQLLSLCGLNCGLCPMLLDGHCGGCGHGNQSCKIARCSLKHGGLEYCFECSEYPCETYLCAGEFDSFISHRNQKLDMEKAKNIGINAYNAEQREKSEILRGLLSDYNDGRRKSFFCTAINLLDLQDIREILQKLSKIPGIDSQPLKEKSTWAVDLFQEAAKKQGVELKLRRKK